MSSLAMTLYAVCLLCHTSSDYLRSGYQYGRTSEHAPYACREADESCANPWPDIDAVADGEDEFCNFDLDTECHV